MNKEKTFELLRKLKEEAGKLSSIEDLHNFEDKAELSLSKIYGNKSEELKKFRDICETYHVSAFVDEIGITGHGQGKVEPSTLEEFKRRVENYLETLMELLEIEN